MRIILFCTLVLGLALPAAAQGWGSVEGRITDAETGAPMPGATVLVDGTNYGTAADTRGAYTLRLPQGRYRLLFSSIGFAPQADSVVIGRRPVRLDVALVPQQVELDEVTVEDDAAGQEAGVYVLDPEDVQRIPSPFKDGFRALKTLPGVATNNELSNQYSVRGGGFNENLVYLNGFEVFLPFRPRQGEQEGLGVINPDLADRITFYTGGFPARYGGKLSSALDVRYRQPERAPLTGTASVSLLDASATAGSGALGGRLGWVAGLRKARASHFFETQELKGAYEPDYTDLQAAVTYRLSDDHQVEALGLWADHVFRLDPNSRKTFFGTISQDPRAAPSNLQSLWINYDPDNEEVDGYTTGFAGLRLRNRLSPRWQVEHDAAYFETVETERFDISGSSVLYQVDPGSGNPQGGEGLLPVGTARQEEAADNRIAVTTWTGQGRYLFTTGRHAAEAGWSARHYSFDDRLDEKSVVSGRSTEGDPVRIVVDSLRDAAALTTQQAGVYIQDAFDVIASQPNRLVVTGGVRADYYDFNGQWTVSPRLSARLRLDARTTLTGAWGLYHQAPTYRELRGKPEPGQTILGALNRGLQAQRAMQFVGGAEYFLPQRRLYLRGEAYYKRLANLITYDVENVRVRYSGENDADGYAYGLDLQLRGEFVPGLESWANYSYLVAREDFGAAYENAYNRGTVARPTDQRHTFSLFIQDYIPNDPSWKLHLRTLFGSGLPYTPPVPGERLGDLVTQEPGPRLSERYPRYFRFDMGVTKQLPLFEHGLSGPVNLELTAELLNVFNMVNTVAYTWVPDGGGIWTRVPTRLTPRTFNVRLRIDF